MPDDLVADALISEAELRAGHEPTDGIAARTEICRLDATAARFIACSPLLFVASADSEGRCDVTPRGGPPGFVTVLDSGEIALPDAPGTAASTRCESLWPPAGGLLFVVPGRGRTLRVNGAAWVTARADVLDRLTAVGKAPRTALIVAPEELGAPCPKAFVRSHLREPESWPGADAPPSPRRSRSRGSGTRTRRSPRSNNRSARA